MSSNAPAETPQKYLGHLRSAAPGFELDGERLAQYLQGRIAGFRGPLSISQFDGGQSNPTYKLTAPGGMYVLRRRPPGVLLASAHAVDREFRVISALFGVGFPVPEPLHLCLDESVIGSQFYVMRFVSGRVFWDCSMPDLSAAERAEVFDSVNATLAQLHSHDPERLGLHGFGRPTGYFERQIRRWSRQYEASCSEDIPEMEKLIAWLPTAVPPDDGRCSVIHGDFSFHNVLIQPTSGCVAAVVDWELSTLGHPLGDLTYHLMEWYRPAGVDLRGTLRGRDLKRLGIPTLEEYVARYCERTGAELPATLPFYRAFNLFRFAAIAQGVASRAAAGNAAASNATALGARVRPLAAAGWEEALAAGAG